jgi:hypothetical protein
MSKPRLLPILSGIMLALAVTAATLDTVNHGRLRLQTVGKLLFFVAIAVILLASNARKLRNAEKPAAPAPEHPPTSRSPEP